MDYIWTEEVSKIDKIYKKSHNYSKLKGSGIIFLRSLIIANMQSIRIRIANIDSAEIVN